MHWMALDVKPQQAGRPDQQADTAEGAQLDG